MQRRRTAKRGRMRTLRNFGISVKIPTGVLWPDEGLGSGRPAISAIIRCLDAVMFDTWDGVAQAPATSTPSRQQKRCGGITAARSPYMFFSGLFKFASQDMAIDLGTANTVVYLRGRG